MDRKTRAQKEKFGNAQEKLIVEKQAVPSCILVLLPIECFVHFAHYLPLLRSTPLRHDANR